ncbi:hypothetical protein [uncultured Sphingomonas sp.]|uniref:hypothetical protein n=1 Tax=uncultured Sphingomonas sp. TaxID=158754 RepID=UPI0035CA63C2
MLVSTVVPSVDVVLDVVADGSGVMGGVADVSVVVVSVVVEVLGSVVVTGAVAVDGSVVVGVPVEGVLVDGVDVEGVVCAITALDVPTAKAAAIMANFMKTLLSEGTRKEGLSSVKYPQ